MQKKNTHEFDSFIFRKHRFKKKKYSNQFQIALTLRYLFFFNLNNAILATLTTDAFNILRGLALQTEHAEHISPNLHKNTPTRPTTQASKKPHLQFQKLYQKLKEKRFLCILLSSVDTVAELTIKPIM